MRSVREKKTHRHVCIRANKRVTLAHGVSQHSTDAKIRNLDLTLVIKQEIGGLNITMYDVPDLM